jgi:thiosulfate reductase/polysulfide reductase chain A
MAGATAGVAGIAMAVPFGDKLIAFAETGTRGPLWDDLIYSSCALCDNKCGILLHMKEGKIMEITGNPADKLGSYGQVCIKGASAMQQLYDPDRLKAPLKRTNTKKGINEDPGWVEITWDEAFETIAEKFQDAIDTSGPESILLLGRPKDPEKRLMNSLAITNQVCHVDTCYLNHDMAWKVTWGGGRPWVLDTENATYLLCFGYDQPGKSKQSHLQGFMNAKENGAKVVMFDPFFSRTANLADEYFQIKPGTDAAVTLAMIKVIIDENLYDSDYVTNYCHGLDELKAHVTDNGYTPEWASGISGIPADDITRIAREFANSERPFIPTHKRDAGGPLYANSFALSQAEIILCALVGTIERPGGFYSPRTPKTPSVDTFAPADYPEITEKRRVDGQDQFPLVNKLKKGNFSHLAQGILSGEPYPLKVGIAKQYGITSFPNPDTIIDALKTLDFFVVCDIYPNELCQLADIVLPDKQFLEKKDSIEIRKYHAMWPQIMLRDGVGTLYDEKGWGGMVNGILKAMGKSDYTVDWTGLEDARVEAAGTTKAAMKSNNGIWEDEKPTEGKTEWKTSTKKIELYSTALADAGYEALPTWHDRLAKPSTTHPYYILVNHHPWFRMCKNVNAPLLMELQPENLLYIHPDTAAKIGVSSGDYVNVESAGTGKTIKIKAEVTKRIRTDCVMTEHAYGHWSKDMGVALNKGTNDGELLPERKTEDTLKIKDYNPGQPSMLLDVCVKLTKA